MNEWLKEFEELPTILSGKTCDEFHWITVTRDDLDYTLYYNKSVKVKWETLLQASIKMKELITKLWY